MSVVLFSSGSGVVLGILATRRPAFPLDIATSVGCLIFHSPPVFRLGQLLLLSMALALELFPAQGSYERRVLGKHTLRNALVPVVNVVGTQLAVLFAGAVLTEAIFGWHGLGRLLLDAALSRDYPLLLGTFPLMTVGAIGANLLADLVCAYLDPRVKYR